MYEIVLSDKAKKQISKLPKNIQERIDIVFERVKIRPHYFVKKIIGTKYFGLRVGDYRLILDIQNKILVIYIIEVGHRKNVYKT